MSAVATPVPVRSHPARWLAVGALVVALVVALAIGIGLVATLAGDAGQQPAVNVPIPRDPAVEARWGVRVSQVGVSADGGLVDVRFVILDPDRALAMLGDDKETNIPVLVVEDGGAVVRSAAMMPPKHTLVAGRTMYLLYRNTGGAIRGGTSLTFEFGNLQLEHVIAE